MSFPWKSGCFFLLLCIGGVVIYDIKTHGHFERSNTNRILKETNALQYANIAWDQIKDISEKTYRWSEENLPDYYRNLNTWLKPYLQLAYELSIVFINASCSIFCNIQDYVIAKVPVVQEWLQEYHVQEALFHIWEVMKEYTLIGASITWKFILDTGEYARNNIFVGKMSPENIQKITLEALNTTQVYATSTFHWVYEKISNLQQ